MGGETMDSNQSAPGTVMITLALNAPAVQVWEALTEPAAVERWFGSLSGGLRPAQPARLEFGDGDFFELEDVHLDPPGLVRYAWRFMGTGPRDLITWRIQPKEQGCLVTVTDIQPKRTYEEAQFLKQGWLDFTQRLETFLATGQSTRYDWRRELDVSLELPGAMEAVWERLFAPGMPPRWLPLSSSGIETGGLFTPTDGLEPAVLQMTNVVWEPGMHVTFQLIHDDWLHPTNCRLELSRRHKGVMLSVNHVGWEAISWQSTDQLQQRRRFSDIWVTSLKCVRQLVDS
jgi:uncharacterized protein YndB with AHSA1/START domain